MRVSMKEEPIAAREVLERVADSFYQVEFFRVNVVSIAGTSTLSIPIGHPASIIFFNLALRTRVLQIQRAFRRYLLRSERAALVSPTGRATIAKTSDLFRPKISLLGGELQETVDSILASANLDALLEALPVFYRALQPELPLHMINFLFLQERISYEQYATAVQNHHLISWILSINPDHALEAEQLSKVSWQDPRMLQALQAHPTIKNTKIPGFYEEIAGCATEQDAGCMLLLLPMVVQLKMIEQVLIKKDGAFLSSVGTNIKEYFAALLVNVLHKVDADGEKLKVIFNVLTRPKVKISERDHRLALQYFVEGVRSYDAGLLEAMHALPTAEAEDGHNHFSLLFHLIAAAPAALFVPDRSRRELKLYMALPSSSSWPIFFDRFFSTAVAKPLFMVGQSDPHLARFLLDFPGLGRKSAEAIPSLFGFYRRFFSGLSRSACMPVELALPASFGCEVEPTEFSRYPGLVLILRDLVNIQLQAREYRYFPLLSHLRSLFSLSSISETKNQRFSQAITMGHMVWRVTNIRFHINSRFLPGHQQEDDARKAVIIFFRMASTHLPIYAKLLAADIVINSEYWRTQLGTDVLRIANKLPRTFSVDLLSMQRFLLSSFPRLLADSLGRPLHPLELVLAESFSAVPYARQLLFTYFSKALLPRLFYWQEASGLHFYPELCRTGMPRGLFIDPDNQPVTALTRFHHYYSFLLARAMVIITLSDCLAISYSDAVLVLRGRSHLVDAAVEPLNTLLKHYKFLLNVPRMRLWIRQFFTKASGAEAPPPLVSARVPTVAARSSASLMPRFLRAPISPIVAIPKPSDGLAPGLSATAGSKFRSPS